MYSGCPCSWANMGDKTQKKLQNKVRYMCDDRHWERKRAQRLADWRVSVRAWLRTSKWVGGRNNWTPYWWRGWVSPEFMIQTPGRGILEKTSWEEQENREPGQGCVGCCVQTLWAALWERSGSFRSCSLDEQLYLVSVLCALLSQISRNLLFRPSWGKPF